MVSMNGLGGPVMGAVTVAGGILLAGFVCRLCPNCCKICTHMDHHCPDCKCTLKCPHCGSSCGKQSHCAVCGHNLHGGWGG